MRGSDERSGALFFYVDREARVRPNHPLRPIREIGNVVRAELGADFEAIYAAGVGRLLISSERLEYDLLLFWFVGIGVDYAV